MLDLSGSNSTLLGGSREGLQVFQPTEGVGVGSPVCGARIRVQKRFGLSHGPAFRFQVHFSIDAGSQDVGVAQPAPDRDHVHTRLQEVGSGGVAHHVGMDALSGQCRHGVGGGTRMRRCGAPRGDGRAFWPVSARSWRRYPHACAGCTGHRIASRDGQSDCGTAAACRRDPRRGFASARAEARRFPSTTGNSGICLPSRAVALGAADPVAGHRDADRGSPGPAPRCRVGERRAHLSKRQ